MKYQNFIFDNFVFDKSSKTLDLFYSFDDQLHFKERYLFDFDFVDYDPEALERSFTLLFLMAGISYFKAYIPSNIIIKNKSVDQFIASFLDKTYQKGLGEFFYTNNLDPNTLINFPFETQALVPISPNLEAKLLVGIGGGKDSLVSVNLLKQTSLDVATWSVGHKPQLTPLIDTVGLNHYWVERIIDPLIIELNGQGALNGHIPISAILACTGTVVAILSGSSDVVVSNEQSANEPTLNYQGVDINHQYSKSQAFEQDFQSVLKHLFGSTIRYYSLLRPFSELYIGELFAKSGFDTYKDVFSSCNRAFTQSSDHLFWDGTCPKCAFIFLILTPFIKREDLESLFSGKNLLLDEGLVETYENLLGISGDKPLECVGEVKESRAAMRLAQDIYPELARYQFDLPSTYDYQTKYPNLIPKEIYELVFKA